MFPVSPIYLLIGFVIQKTNKQANKQKQKQGPGVVAHAFNLGGRGRRISEFEANLIYKVSSRTARAIQRNPVSKTNKQKQTKKTKADKITTSSSNNPRFPNNVSKEF